ncbi:MAG TPA: CPBP family intramembrane glutamic endopeptidase [Nakamurella sp.]
MHPDPGDPPTQPLAVVTSPVPVGRSPWTFVDVFAGLGAVLLFGTVLGAVVRITGPDLGSAALVVSALPVWIGLLGTAVWACRRHGTGSLVQDLALRIRPIDLAIGLGAGLGLRFVIGIWAVICTRLTGQQPESNLQEVLGGRGLGAGAWLVINMLAIALVGPLIEEIFFRGVGLRGALAGLLRRSNSRPRLADPRRRARIAIAATALMFALLHVSEVNDAISALVLLPGLFCAGAVLGWLTIRTGRLGPAVVTHVVFNAVAVVALLTLGGSA